MATLDISAHPTYCLTDRTIDVRLVVRYNGVDINEIIKPYEAVSTPVDWALYMLDHRKARKTYLKLIRALRRYTDVKQLQRGLSNTYHRSRRFK